MRVAGREWNRIEQLSRSIASMESYIAISGTLMKPPRGRRPEASRMNGAIKLPRPPLDKA